MDFGCEWCDEYDHHNVYFGECMLMISSPFGGVLDKATAMFSLVGDSESYGKNSSARSGNIDSARVEALLAVESQLACQRVRANNLPASS